MSIKKSLIALAAMALSLMGFASSATAATDGVLRDVVNTGAIAENHELHFIGFARFENAAKEGYECHVTAVAKAIGATGTTLNVTQFTIPDTTKCTGNGPFKGCKLKLNGHQTTNLPYHVTVTPTDFDVTPITGGVNGIVIDNEFEGCLVTSVKLTFGAITLKPIQTGARTITGGANPGKMGLTAEAGTATQHSKTSGVDQGNPIAGVELSGTAEAHVKSFVEVTEAVAVSGELELTSPDRCTYYLSTN